MQKAVKALGLVIGLLCARPSHAVIGTIDNVPAATVLLPYFEVDPTGSDTRGVNTLVDLTNSSATAILVHVVVWTDASVPVTNFNVYLTGWDTVTMSLRSLLAGNLPQTASAGQDPQDAISNKGQLSQDINFASCTGKLPPQPVEAATVAQWQAALTGKPDPVTNLCAGIDHGDGILRGYITADLVNNCTVRFPGDPGYFGPGGSGDVTNQNVLYGTWTLVDGASRRFFNGPLVSIEASGTDPETSAANQYTFYGRYVSWSAADNREPLSTNFGTRFVNTGGTGAPSSTQLIVWRDPKVKQAAFPCAIKPTWGPLGQEGITFFNEQEDPEMPPAGTPFPYATQRVLVDSAALPVSFATGWMFLNLNTTVAQAGGNPTEDPAAAQAWVEVLTPDADPPAYGARGHVGLTHHPVLIDNASKASHFLYPH